MAQRTSRKRRKERRRAEAAPAVEEREAAPAVEERPAASADNPMARRYARGREKDAAARAALEPLGEGERPGAVTVAGVLALLLGLANIAAYAAGLEVQGDRPSVVGVLFYSGLMFVAAWGCLTSRYWAVLGMQVLLGLLLVIFSLLIIRAETVLSVVIALAVLGSAGTLFWKLVKAMARIQMPARPGAE